MLPEKGRCDVHTDSEEEEEGKGTGVPGTSRGVAE